MILQKGILSICITLLCCFAFCVGVSAEDSVSVPKEFYGIIDSLPEDTVDNIPPEIYSEDISQVGNALMHLTDEKFVFSFMEDILEDRLAECVRLLAKLCGILVISAVFSTFRKSIWSGELSRTLDFCSSCIIFAMVVGLLYKQIESVSVFFEQLNSLMISMIPVTGAVYAMGGNIGTAVVDGGAMYGFLAVSEGICAKTVVPVSIVCTALALCRGVSPGIDLRGLASGIKKCYTFLLGFIMTILLALLATRTYLASAADSTAARAVKTVVSSTIPIVGASVSDTLRTVASSVQYIKSIVGVGGIIFILMLLLPTLISLLLTRLTFIFSVGVADLLGCESESRLLGELGNVCGCMIAAVSMSSVMFIMALNIFIKTTVAML